MNHNQVLGVSQGASTNEIQAAFRKAALEVHPDHSSSPEAAEAFGRIKQARDELMKRARDAERQRDTTNVQSSTAAAIRATTAAAFSTSVVDDLFDGMTPAEVAHVQQLDELIRQAPKRTLFGRIRESTEVARHRRKIATNNKRIVGKY